MRILKTVPNVVALAAAALCGFASSALAAPPPPPALPVTPVGGGEVSLATAACIAAYGIWKSRR